jgi:Flp pilus assembly protein TadG
MPLLFALMAGVIDLAHTFSVAGIVANAAREGARYGATDPTNTDAIATRVVEEAAGAPLTVDPSEVTVNTDAGASSGSAITVKVTHPVQLIMAQALGLPQPTIVRTATMVIF